MITEKQLQEISRELNRLEKVIEEEILTSKNNSQPVKLDQQAVGRVSRIDAIQQQQMHLSALRRLEKRLIQIKSAKNRITTEGFGYCANCEEPISFERLMARPESPHCIDCVKKREESSS